MTSRASPPYAISPLKTLLIANASLTAANPSIKSLGDPPRGKMISSDAAVHRTIAATPSTLISHSRQSDGYVTARPVSSPSDSIASTTASTRAPFFNANEISVNRPAKISANSSVLASYRLRNARNVVVTA